MRTLLSCLTLMGLCVAASACLVNDTFCIQNGDCPSGEICRVNAADNATRSCQAPDCQTDIDCWIGGTSNGKICRDGLCRFGSGGTRFPAPEFCLTVANPKSEHHDKERCLSDERGKVVLLFFGLLA